MEWVGGREWKSMEQNSSKKGSICVWYYFSQISIELLGQEFWICVWIYFYWFFIYLLQYFLSLRALLLMMCGCYLSSLWLGTWALGPQSLCPPCVSPHVLQERRSNGSLILTLRWLECSFLAMSHTWGFLHVQPISGVPLGLLPVPAVGRVVIPFIYKRSLNIWKI